MSTTLIQIGATSGALAGLMNIRSQSGTQPSDYGIVSNVASAIGVEVVAANAALVSPMKDSDNSQISELLAAVTMAVISARGKFSTVASDYAPEATLIVAACKEILGSLPVSPAAPFVVDLQAAPVAFAAVGANALVTQNLVGITGVLAGDIVFCFQAAGLDAAGVETGTGFGTGPGAVTMPTANATAIPFAGGAEASSYLVIRPAPVSPFVVNLQAAPVTFAAVPANSEVTQHLTGITGVQAGDVVYCFQAAGLDTAGVMCATGYGTGAGAVTMPTFNVTAVPYAGAAEASSYLVVRP